MTETYQQLIALAQVTMIDVALAGDNAIVVGLAASRVAPQMRRKVVSQTSRSSNCRVVLRL